MSPASKRRRRRAVGVLACVVVVAACGSEASRDQAAVVDLASAPEAEIGMPAPPATAAAGIRTPAQEPGETRLIRSGTIRIEVDDLEGALDRAAALAAEVDGYVAQSETREQGRSGGRTAELLLRVPASSFDGVVDELATLGRVLSESVSVSDVSREYFDLETRLAVREETVQRLRDLGAEGGDLQELLAIERELGRALEELETLKGRLVYYDRRIAESDLRVFLAEPGAVISDGAFRPVREALHDAADVFARSLASLVYLVVFIAPWAVLAAVVFAGVRALWIRRRARASRGADA